MVTQSILDRHSRNKNTKMLNIIEEKVLKIEAAPDITKKTPFKVVVRFYQHPH